MSLFHWVRRTMSPPKPAAWAVEIARNCHAAVAVRLGQALYRMSLPQARGYIRSRAAEILDQELIVLQQRTGCPRTLVATVRELAAEEVVRMAISDLLKSTRQPTVLRKAA